ncbi:MAG TPA: hypothetical protein VKU79_03505 [Thermoplasmataceae archaeon]|nr:hypothetical protein [Thermoplasmatales archaeon AK]HLH85915.1 hypothetical protein [Thermoplasmataceae archaeon]
MPQVNISGGIVILGSRSTHIAQAHQQTTSGTSLSEAGLAAVSPLNVSIGTVSALALAEVLASSTIVFSGSVLTVPTSKVFLAGVKQQMIADIGVLGSGSILVTAYSLQPQFATIFPLNAIDGTLATSGWVSSSTVPSAFRLYNNSGTVPLSPIISLEFVPAGVIQTWCTLTLAFR